MNEIYQSTAAAGAAAGRAGTGWWNRGNPSTTDVDPDWGDWQTIIRALGVIAAAGQVWCDQRLRTWQRTQLLPPADRPVIRRWKRSTNRTRLRVNKQPRAFLRIGCNPPPTCNNLLRELCGSRTSPTAPDVLLNETNGIMTATFIRFVLLHAMHCSPPATECIRTPKLGAQRQLLRPRSSDRFTAQSRIVANHRRNSVKRPAKHRIHPAFPSLSIRPPSLHSAQFAELSKAAGESCNFPMFADKNKKAKCSEICHFLELFNRVIKCYSIKDVKYLKVIKLS